MMMMERYDHVDYAFVIPIFAFIFLRPRPTSLNQNRDVVDFYKLQNNNM